MSLVICSEDSITSAEDLHLEDQLSLIKKRKASWHSAKNVLVKHRKIANDGFTSKLDLEESEGDNSRCELLTKASTNSSQISPLDQSPQACFSASKTLEQIVKDSKNGLPSLNEEKQRQMRILKQKKLQRKQEEEEENESSQKKEQDFSSNEVNSLLIAKIPPTVRDITNNRISSNAFNEKKNHTKKWTEEETKRFYKALQLFGTDFSLLQQLFPLRTRIMIKNKFRKEEKDNSPLVEQSLKLYSNRKFVKIQSRLQTEKQKISAITLDSSLQERVSLLLEERKRRLNSFESVDSEDIMVAEEVNEIFRIKSNLSSEVISHEI